jgi:23S rRNA pseudouridine1911/1915/1917 synthase
VIGRGRNLADRREKIEVPVRATEPQRLDLYLGAQLNWKSRTRLKALIRSGKVKVNDEPAKPARRVRAGDVVTLELSAGAGSPEDYDDLELEVLYEDPWVLAISKPPGLLVHPVGRHVYDTLMNHLHHRYRSERDEDGSPVVPRLCHRLDRDTTGVLVIAKDQHVHREVMGQFERRLVSKEYVALVRGEHRADSAEVSLPIGEGRCLRTCLEHDVLKDSRTGIAVLSRLVSPDEGPFTLVACVPHTGRQNQIRVHLAASGHPLAGDSRYGGGDPPRGFPQRYLLHSRAIRFYHPRLKSDVELAAELPPDFRELIERLAPVAGHRHA